MQKNSVTEDGKSQILHKQVDKIYLMVDIHTCIYFIPTSPSNVVKSTCNISDIGSLTGRVSHFWVWTDWILIGYHVLASNYGVVQDS